jgi:hypothetical protein
VGELFSCQQVVGPLLSSIGEFVGPGQGRDFEAGAHGVVGGEEIGVDGGLGGDRKGR